MKSFILGLLLSVPAVAASPGDIVSDLQTMGIPAGVPKSDQHGDKIETLYEHNPSSPTILGRLLHISLGRLSRRERAQLQFQLARNDLSRLDEALQLLDNVPEGEPGGPYDDVAQAYLDKAADALRPGESAPALAGAEKDGPAVREVLLQHQAKLLLRQVAAYFLSGKDEGLGEAIGSLGAASGGTGRMTPKGLFDIVRALPEDALNEAQWKALASAFPMGDSINRMEAMKLWRAGITGKGVKVGVIDNGADEAHPYLRGIKVHQNFISERHLKGPQEGQPDNRGSHGSHVAGTIRALAPEAEIRVYKTIPAHYYYDPKVPKATRLQDEQEAEATARGMQCAADDGCSVLSISLGWDKGAPIAPEVLVEKTAQLGKKRVVSVVASSNDGPNTGTGPGYSEHALTVGAVSYTGHQGRFSSRQDVPLKSDGKTSVLAKPDCLAYGVQVCSSQTNGDSDYKDPRKLYVRWNGTSMATPHVSGVLALLQQRAKELGKELSPNEWKALLRETGTKPKTGPYGATAVDLNAALKKLEGGSP